MSQLVTQMDISLPALSQSLDVLETKGMIERVKDAKDKRVTNVLLTRKSRMIMRHHRRHPSLYFNELFDYLGHKDSAELVRLMERVGEFTKTHKFIKDKGPDAKTC
jgi:DNA-binding MarR family transcriptional regulator